MRATRTSIAPRLRSVLAAVALLVVIVVGQASPAAAHTALLETIPDNRATFDEPPETLTIVYAEPVDPSSVTLSIVDTEGNSFEGFSLLTPSSPDSATIVFQLPDLPEGVYGFPFVTVGPDGHRVAGEVVMGIGTFDQASLSSATFSSTPLFDRVLSVASGIGRFLWYVGLALFVGALFTRWWHSGRGEKWGASAAVLADHANHRVWQGIKVLALGQVLRAVATTWLVARGSGSSGLDAFVDAVQSRTGLVALGGLVLVGALAMIAALIGRSDAEAVRTPVVAGAVGVAALVAITQINSHPATLSESFSGVTVSALHVLGAALWVGPLMLLTLAAVQAAWGESGERAARTATVQSFFASFAPFAFAAFLVLVVTGLRTSFVTVGGNLFSSSYGWVLVVKLALIAAVIVPLSLYHDREVGWLARRRDDDADEGIGLGSFQLEARVLVGIVGIAAVLTGLNPGTFANAASEGGGTSVVASGSILSDEAVSDVADCADLTVGKRDCYRKYFSSIMEAEGADVAVATIARLEQEGDPYVLTDCHQVVHDLGNDAAVYYGDLGIALSYEGSACWSGYYHGVVEYVLSLYDDDQLFDKLPSVCASPAESQPYSFTHYNCLHGVGHGVMLRLDGDLFTSLPYCEKLTDVWERSSCLSGAFMENIVAAQQEAFRTTEGGLYDDYTPSLDDENLLYPCSDLEEHLAECYAMQTSWVLFKNGRDYANAFELCGGVQDGFVDDCYRSMGRDISGDSLLDVNRVLALCALGVREYQSECYVGASLNAVYNDHNTVKATELCELVPSDMADACFSARDYAASTF